MLVRIPLLSLKLQILQKICSLVKIRLKCFVMTKIQKEGLFFRTTLIIPKELEFELSRSFRVRIIASHFRNYEMNSSHCDWKIANHMKIAKQFFAPRKNLSRSTLYFATLYLHFIYPLYTIIKRNIADNQNYIAKCKKRLCNYYFF